MRETVFRNTAQKLPLSGTHTEKMAISVADGVADLALGHG
jgi:hypothetical protein